MDGVVAHNASLQLLPEAGATRKLSAVSCKAWFGSGARGTWTLAPVIQGSSLCGPGPWRRRCRRIQGELLDDLLVHPQFVD